MLMIAPLMIADFTTGKLDIKSTQFRIITGLACIIGLTVPLIGGNPIEIQILTQVFLVVPLVVGSILVLINRKSLMGKYKANWILNLGVGAAMLFSIIISYNAFMVIIG